MSKQLNNPVIDRFKTGEMVYVRGFVSIWTEDLSNSCDSMTKGELAIVVADEDDYGWVCTLTPRGAIGLIHQSNLNRIY